MSLTRFNMPGVYNPAQQTKSEILSNFVVRLREYHSIFTEIKTGGSGARDNGKLHFIIQGLRGSGKTTLLHRLYHGIKDDRELSAYLIPILFNEEQYGIRMLHQLWEETADYLADENPGLFKDLKENMLEQGDVKRDDYHHKCFQFLVSEVRAKNKKLVLFIDNFGEMVHKFSATDQQNLKESLESTDVIRIAGASSKTLESIGVPSLAPLFKTFKLDALDRAEATELLLQLGKTYNDKQVKEIMKNQPHRVEALRRITGGVPRTMVLLFEIFVDNHENDAFHDLEIILDRMTPLYKHRMDSLAPQKQELVDIIALNWDAMGVKDIIKKTQLQSKAISAQLNDLEKNGLIKKIRTSTKNHFYQLNERFFNIWYLMRNGKKRGRQKVIWLTRFLQHWCKDKTELNEQAGKHISLIQAGKLMAKHADYYTEAFAAAAIDDDIHHKLLTTTRQYLTPIDAQLAEQLTPSIAEALTRVLVLADTGDTQKIEALVMTQIEIVQPIMYLMLTRYTSQGIEKEPRMFLWAFKKTIEHDVATGGVFTSLFFPVVYPLCNIGMAFDPAALEKFFRQGLKNGNPFCGALLARVLFEAKKGKGESLRLMKELFNNEYFKRIETLESFDCSEIYLLHALLLFWNKRNDAAVKEMDRALQSIDALFDSELLVTALTIALARRQYAYVLQLMENKEWNLKDRYRPVYYALMNLMKDRFPNEYLKMGDEMKETVGEILHLVHNIV